MATEKLYYSDAYLRTFEANVLSCEPAKKSWLVTLDGPIVQNGIYFGETYDARRCEFAWKNAVAVEAPKGTLRLQDVPPIRRVAQFAPEAIERLADGTYIITSPEMSAGWIKLRVNAPRGTEIVLTYSETLVEDGHVLRNGKNEGPNGGWWPNEYIQQDTYISDGNEADGNLYQLSNHASIGRTE